VIRCDFCDREMPGVWRYPARDIRLAVGESTGDWAACEECHALLEKDDRRGLLERALAIMIRKPEIRETLGRDARAVMRMGLEHIHGKFFEARLPGPARNVALDNISEGENRARSITERKQ
jgi:hypothetical protein